MTTRRPSVLIADDHTIVAEGLVRLLSRRFDVVATVADGAALVEAAERLRPDVVIVDLNMPSMSGLDAMERLRKDGLASKFVILTMQTEARLAAKAMRAGASAFVLKHSAGNELIDAIDEVLDGRTYLSRALTKEILDTLDERRGSEVELTRRQRDVLRLDRRGPADERDRRDSRPLGSYCRDTQVRNDARAGCRNRRLSWSRWPSRMVLPEPLLAIRSFTDHVLP